MCVSSFAYIKFVLPWFDDFAGRGQCIDPLWVNVWSISRCLCDPVIKPSLIVFVHCLWYAHFVYECIFDKLSYYFIRLGISRMGDRDTWIFLSFLVAFVIAVFAMEGHGYIRCFIIILLPIVHVRKSDCPNQLITLNDGVSVTRWLDFISIFGYLQQWKSVK